MKRSKSLKEEIGFNPPEFGPLLLGSIMASCFFGYFVKEIIFTRIIHGEWVWVSGAGLFGEKEPVARIVAVLSTILFSFLHLYVWMGMVRVICKPLLFKQAWSEIVIPRHLAAAVCFYLGGVLILHLDAVLVYGFPRYPYAYRSTLLHLFILVLSFPLFVAVVVASFFGGESGSGSEGGYKYEPCSPEPVVSDYKTEGYGFSDRTFRG